MKKIQNKRWVLIIATVMVMVMATAGFAVSGFKHQMGRFHGKGFVKERMLGKVDYMVQELKLTADQQGKYSVIRETMSVNLDKIAKRHDEVRNSIHTEMDKPNPDVRAIAKTVKSEIRTMPDMVTAQIDSLLEVYEILDANQQKQLVSMMKERMDDRKHGKRDRDCF